MADYTGHTTALEAARIAKMAYAKRLILGHFSNRYDDLSVFLDEAKTIFENTELPRALQRLQLSAD